MLLLEFFSSTLIVIADTQEVAIINFWLSLICWDLQ